MVLKKILLVGFFNKDENKYSYSDSFYNKLLELGYIVEKFNYRKKIFFLSKINSWLIHFFLLRRAKSFNPDLIFFIKAETIYSKTIKKLKKNNCSMVNFYPDNPFVFCNGNSNKEVLNSLPYYDCFLSWSKLLMPILSVAGCRSVYSFPFAYDKYIFEKNINEQDISNYKNEVCFAGTWEPEREEWLTGLVQRLPNLDLFIYGNLWHENLTRDSILRKFLKGKAIYKDELIETFKTSKIVLNFIRKQNGTSHNMRTFEVPATGAFLLTQRTKEQAEELFKESESIECFGSTDELVSKIQFYLKNDDLRRLVALNGKKRSKEFELKIVLKNFMEYIHKH